MEKKFTPGECKAKGLHILCDGKVGSIGQAFVMNISCDNTGKSIPDIEGEANAALWAASKDLLEALEDMLSIAIYANEFDPELIADERISIARKAISKALNIPK